MSRIAIVTAGTYGDIAPLAGLGARFRGAGHEVVITGSERYRAVASEARIDFVPLAGADPQDLSSSELGQAAGRAGAKGTSSLIRGAADAMRDQVEGMKLAAEHADVVLCTLSTIPLALPVAEARGIPCVVTPLQIAEPTRELGPTFLGGRDLGPWLNRAVPRAVGKLGLRAFASLTLSIRADLGLPKKPRPGYLPDDLPVLCGVSPTVVPRPSDWRADARIAGYWWPPVPTGWRPPAELEQFLDAGPAPVYFGFGSVGVGDSARLSGLVRDVVARTGIRAVVHRGWAELDIDHDNVLTIDETPHEWLLPRTTAAVHHAGAGTTAAVLRAGIASVPLPFVHDQPFWARRLVALGTAPEWIPAKKATPDRVASGLARALEDPSFGDAAARISDAIRTEDGAAVVIAAVERILRG